MPRTATAEPRPGTTTEVVRRALMGKRTDVGGVLFQGVLLLTLLLALATLVTLIASVLQDAVRVFADRGTDFLTSNLSSLPERAGVAQGIFGSVMLMAFVVVISFPLGIGAAIYIEEYARDTRFTRFIQASIRNLAGVPSVVYGLLGLAIFVKLLAGATGGRSLMSGGLTMAILVLPIVIITSAEAIRAVPSSIREAGYGVGATRWEVVRSHVLPYAAPGVLTGTILSLARALGEAAPLLLIGGAPAFFAAGSRGVVETLRGDYTALPAIIFTWSRKSLRAFGDSTAAAIVVLLVVLLLINAAAIYLRNRYERRW
jgi:phosphate transport system permease protein